MFWVFLGSVTLIVTYQYLRLYFTSKGNFCNENEMHKSVHEFIVKIKSWTVALLSYLE